MPPSPLEADDVALGLDDAFPVLPEVPVAVAEEFPVLPDRALPVAVALAFPVLPDVAVEVASPLPPDRDSYPPPVPNE